MGERREKGPAASGGLGWGARRGGRGRGGGGLKARPLAGASEGVPGGEAAAGGAEG
jgi:hypothetical protein